MVANMQAIASDNFEMKFNVFVFVNTDQDIFRTFRRILRNFKQQSCSRNTNLRKEYLKPISS